MNKKQKQHQSVVPGNAMAVKVIGNAREDVGYAIKSWKRKVKSAGILEEVKDRKEYTKPGVKRRKEIQHASFMQYVRDLHSK
jgi:small subunit ribosomal protein S21